MRCLVWANVIRLAIFFPAEYIHFDKRVASSSLKNEINYRYLPAIHNMRTFATGANSKRHVRSITSPSKCLGSVLTFLCFEPLESDPFL